MQSEQELERVLSLYADMIRRICMVYLKNTTDTEDIFQTVFLKFLLHDTPFESPAHEKAWFIRVTLNACKDFLKNFFRKHTVPISELLSEQQIFDETSKDVLSAVLSLPTKYKEVIYLYYYEGYTAVEIATLLHKNVNTVYTLLSRAKKQLAQTLGGDLLAE